VVSCLSRHEKNIWHVSDPVDNNFGPRPWKAVVTALCVSVSVDTALRRALLSSAAAAVVAMVSSREALIDVTRAPSAACGTSGCLSTRPHRFMPPRSRQFPPNFRLVTWRGTADH